MPPFWMGAAVAAVVIATYALVRRALTLQPQPQPVRAEAPIRRLRRDPVTGEYRPF
jgi:hypothetical protein